MSVAMGRTAAAKAVLAATMGAMQCLTRSMQEEPSPQHMVVVMAAVAALDRMVYLQAIPQDVRVMDWTLQDLDAVCAMIPCKPEEEEFLDRLEQLQETSSPAKSTARSTRRKTASSPKVTSPDIVVLTQALEVLQGDTSSQRIDARVVVKRWASTAIVWYRQGQRQLLQCVHHLAQQKNESCFELSRLLGRLLAIVAESGTNCGLRPPGGAMDQYIVSLGACHSPNENNENKRVDIRDWVVVTIQDVLQVHRQCLVESNSPICNDTEPSVASNRDTDVDVDVFTAPNLSVILHSLCRAAVSTVSDSGVSKQSEFTQVLMGIVTALCFLLLSDVDVPLDCQLSHFAISNLNETLRLLDEQPPPSSVATDVEVQERHSKLENTFHLQTPLPLPVIPQDDTIHGEDQSSTFAGLLTMRHEFTNEDVLSLTLRAVLQYDRKGRRLRIQEFLESQDDEEGGVTSQSKLLSVLTNLICRAMDTRIQPKLRTDMEEEVHLDTKPKAKGGRKRVAKTSGGRKTKQLKREKEQSASQQDEKDGASEYTRISTSRALLAKKIFTTLRHCLTIQKIPSSVLARSIRDVLDMDHLNDLISLGNLLDQVLIKTRTGVSRFSTTTNASESDAQATDPLSSPNICVHSNEFTSIERNLWSSHMIMCQVLGRGQTRYDGSLQSVLTEQQRKYTVQVIAGGKNSPWPLSLPAAHHAFLHANFTSNSVESHDSMAEQHLLTCFIKSIRKALQNLDEIQSFSKDSHCLYLDDGVLLSYNDARTILLAFSRLSAEDQRKSIEGLTNLLLSTLKGIQSDFSKQNNVAKNEEACIFIARVVVLTSAMVSMLVFGQPLRQALFADAGPTIISPPSFYSANEWYHCERTYMGLLDDWECPAVPELSSSSSPPRWTLLTERSLQNMRSLLELAFAIGFEAARKDQCYLLFAAWNGLGKLYSEGGNERLKVSDSTSLQINADNYPKRILQLRDDVCMIHNEVNNISEGQRTSTSTKLRSNLKSTLHRANILMGRLLESATTDEDVPISLFCLLAALPTYISSSISAHTKSDSDYFSTELAKRSPKQGRRQRAYSSESDRINSDAESVDSDGGDNDSDVRVDVVSRLRECCDAFGAAPIHPDWLDVSCSFQEGIRNSDAIDNAETALRMLNKLTATAFKEYKKNFLSALQAYKPNSSENDEFVALALDLLPWNTHEPSFASPLGPGTYSDDRDWKEDVSALCDLPEGLLDLVIDETLVKNIETAKESWCPNASLRLSGRLQDQKRPLSGWETSAPELRAGGEWELLLAEALTAACIAVKQYPEEATVTELESDDDPGAHSVSSIQRDLNDGRLQKGHIALKRAQIWRLIIATATSHMLPAAALLRMGINKAGRKPHPFSFHENNQDPYDVAPLYFSERLGHITHGSQLIRATTYQTVALLSNLSAHGDDSLSSICHAIASHLLVDTKSFCDMEGLQSIRLAFNGLKNLYQLAGSLKDKESSLAVFPFIVERLTFILADFSHIPVDVDSDKDQQSIARLLSFFGASGARTVDTIVGDSIDMFEILKGKEAEETMNVVSSSTWLKDETSLKGLDNLIAVLSGLPIKSNERSRACAAEILSNLVTGERRYLKDKACTSSILPVITTCFNNLAEDDVKNVILDNLIFWDITPSPSHQTSLSHLLQHMVGDGDRFHHAKFVLGVLVESFDRWPRSHGKDTLKPAFDCLLAFGCKFNALNEIGAKILSLKSPPLVNPSTDDDVVDLDVVTNFFSFVKDFRDAFQKKDGIVKINVDKVQNEVDIQESRKAQSAMTLATRCSFVEKTGYHGQHWYNCYTCGLVWEKGCCTLCALVCHKGHDVSYSRYSSFFCDCAAEDGASSSQNRVSCRCMIQLPADEVKKLLEAESADVNVEQQQAVVESTEIRSKEVDFSSRRIDIAFTSFGASAKVAVANLEKCLEAEAWFVALFNLLRHQLMVWKETKDPASDILPRLDNVMPCRAPPPRRVPPLILRKRLRKRHALPLDLHHLSAKTMIPIRCVKGFQTRLSTDTSTNAHLLAKLSRNDITRCNILADSRGRLVIAEPCSLTFCITSPAVATRYASKSSETPLPRQQMCILGSSSISFNIVGIRLCSKNERHMIVWGVAEACVVIIKPHWDGAERKIDLVLDFEQTDGDSDYLVKCDFVPGSQTSVVVGCGHYVRVFDITRSKDNRANAVVAYNLGFEVSLRDIALVPCVPFNNTENEIDTTCRSTHSMISKMFMLLENGRLHAVDLTTDAEGRMESPSDEPCELSGSVSLPTEGVRPRTGSPIGVAGSTAKSLGEGSRIVYLQQSRTLLYKCVSSCVVALMLDGCGSVEGSFELIPHVLSSDILWNGMDGHSIVGPFNHWTELGVVYSDGRMYFRVACIGRSSRTNQPQVVCVEFNEKDVKVKEILWNSGTSSGLSTSLSFEGLCAFSLPFVGNAVKECHAFGERAFLCTTTSAGSLLFFGEEVVDTVKSSCENGDAKMSFVNLSGVSSLHVDKPSFPLTIYEGLKNVSECEELVFVGEGTGW